MNFDCFGRWAPLVQQAASIRVGTQWNRDDKTHLNFKKACIDAKTLAVMTEQVEKLLNGMIWVVTEGCRRPFYYRSKVELSVLPGSPHQLCLLNSQGQTLVDSVGSMQVVTEEGSGLRVTIKGKQFDGVSVKLAAVLPTARL